MDGGCLTGLLMMCCLFGLCLAPSFLLASMVFPAARLRVYAPDGRMFVHWRASYRETQVVLGEGGPVTRSVPFRLQLDGRVLAEGQGEFSSDRWLLVQGLEPGEHTLRLEAWTKDRRAVHEVRFEVVAAPWAPWSLRVLPDDGEAYAFDVRGRAYRLPRGERPATYHADDRGVYRADADGRVAFAPWHGDALTWEDLPDPPHPNRGALVGPGLWWADRLYQWDGAQWRALPPLPRRVPQAVAAYYGEAYDPFHEHAQFFWARVCDREVWVSLAWRVQGEPEHYAYLARLPEGVAAWEVVAPPSPHGFYLLYCAYPGLWLVNTASDGSPLDAKQFWQGGPRAHQVNPWHFAEDQGLGRTYRWVAAAARWDEAPAPPLVMRVYISSSSLLPSALGPALFMYYEGQRWAMLPRAR